MTNTTAKAATVTADGGYYAIKGFTFQFDKSLIEAITNKDDSILIEQTQDVSRNNYYIQIKHKEAKTYSPSKIRPAVIQLLDDFKNNSDHTYSLYCYFKDKKPAITSFTIENLDAVLGVEAKKYTVSIKRKFIRAFQLEFSLDFDGQFKKLMALIISDFGLKSEEEAVLHHASFRAELLNLSTQKTKSKRQISFTYLQGLINKNEKIIFEVAYSKYLTNAKYLNYVKKNFFTHKRLNVASHERFFVLCLEGNEKDATLIQIIQNIRKYYYIQDQSPAPYIMLTGINGDKCTKIKRSLWDKQMYFVDGTNFDGDNFRLEDIKKDLHTQPNNKTTFKWVDQGNLEQIEKAISFDEKFVFMCNNNDISSKTYDGQKFYVQSASDILTVIP